MKKLKKISLGDLAMQALTAAVAKVVEAHRRTGQPLAVWRDGKVVWIPAAKLARRRNQPPQRAIRPSQKLASGHRRNPPIR